MLKLKDLITLDEMKYSGEIKPKHKKRMEKELKLTHEVQVRHNPPPLNSSRETRKELEWLKHYNCLLYTSPSPRDLSTSRMPSSA